MSDKSASAFPFEHGHSPDAVNVKECGMTLRDYFAAQALVGLITVPNGDILSTNDLAKQAYRTADAMLREREVDRGHV